MSKTQPTRKPKVKSNLHIFPRHCVHYFVDRDENKKYLGHTACHNPPSKSMGNGFLCDDHQSVLNPKRSKPSVSDEDSALAFFLGTLKREVEAHRASLR